MPKNNYMSDEQINKILDDLDPVAEYQKYIHVINDRREATFLDAFAAVNTPPDAMKLHKPKTMRLRGLDVMNLHKLDAAKLHTVAKLATTSVYRNPLQDRLRIRGYFAKALDKLNLSAR